MHEIWHGHFLLCLVWNSFQKFGKSQNKTGHGEQKTSKNLQNSSTDSHVFTGCDKTVKEREQKMKTGFSMGLF